MMPVTFQPDHFMDARRDNPPLAQAELINKLELSLTSKRVRTHRASSRGGKGRRS